MINEGVKAALEILKIFLWEILNFAKTLWEHPLVKALIIISAIVIIIALIIAIIIRKTKKKIKIY